MSDTAAEIEEELDAELRGVSARVLVWLAVATGIGMAVAQVVRAFQKRRRGDPSTSKPRPTCAYHDPPTGTHHAHVEGHRPPGTDSR